MSRVVINQIDHARQVFASALNCLNNFEFEQTRTLMQQVSGELLWIQNKLKEEEKQREK